MLAQNAGIGIVSHTLITLTKLDTILPTEGLASGRGWNGTNSGAMLPGRISSNRSGCRTVLGRDVGERRQRGRDAHATAGWEPALLRPNLAQFGTERRNSQAFVTSVTAFEVGGALG